MNVKQDQIGFVQNIKKKMKEKLIVINVIVIVLKEKNKIKIVIYFFKDILLGKIII